MDETADVSTLPVELEGSLDPGQLPEITFRNSSHMASIDQGSPHTVNRSNSGRLSPVRGRTIKEYDQQISDLKKENFSLKMRIFYMEERMQQRYGDGQDVFKTNIELQVQVEKLKKDLADKQDLVQKAATAMDTLTLNHRQAEESMKSRILSEFREEMDHLQAQLEDSNKECEKSRNNLKDAEKKLESLQDELADGKAALKEANKEKDVLSNKLNDAEFEIQQLMAQLKLSEQAKTEREKDIGNLNQQLRDLNHNLQDSQKELTRRDRDLQDEIEDALENIKRKDDKIDLLEDQLQDKAKRIGSLEDSLKEMEEKWKECESGRRGLKKELEQEQAALAKCKSNAKKVFAAFSVNAKEADRVQAELADAKATVKSLQEALKTAEADKAQALHDITKEVTDLEVDNMRLKRQLSELEKTAENMVMSLGKKEGELAGFKDQLKRAMDAVQSSNDAVEMLHEQLKSERAEFDRKLKEQALSFQAATGTNVESCVETSALQLSDLEKDQNAERVQAELADAKATVKSLQEALKAAEADKAQALETPRIWFESHHRQESHHYTHDKTGDQSQELLTDLKKLLEQLSKEMLSLSRLHQLLSGLNKSGDTAASAELLLSEISSVQRIYRQLEGGVEKNSQLHQALLNSLRGEHRQSDSPDSNSCQDGGHNLGGLRDQQLRSGEDQQTLLDQGNPGLVDQSFQTGSALSQVDQWAQTSPGPVAARTSAAASDISPTSKQDTTNLDQPQPLQPNQSPASCAGVRRNYPIVDQDRHSHVHFADRIDNDDLRFASLTDDAKGVGPLSEGSLTHSDEHHYHHHDEDYFDFRQGALFDDGDFEVRAHDRASSGRPDVRSPNGSPALNDSENATVPCSSASSIPTSSAANGLSGVPGLSLHTNTSEGAHSSDSASPKSGQAELFEGQNRSHTIDFNNHRSSASFASPRRKSGFSSSSSSSSSSKLHTNKSPHSRSEDSSRERRDDVGPQRDSAGAGLTQEEADVTLVEGEGHRSRRSSWAEELEQYKIHEQGQDSTTSKQEEASSHNCAGPQGQRSEPDTQQPGRQHHQVTANMSTVELRDLVAQLQLDLMDAAKENRALQHKLTATNSKITAVNNPFNLKPSSAVVNKSKIPVPHGSSSLHSISDESDCVGTARSSQRGRRVLFTNGGPSLARVSGPASRSGRGRTASADQATATTLQGKLNDSHAQIKNLQSKLQATENTVRLLSKKNKVFVSALESAGVSTAALNRSNSESCLASFSKTPPHKTASTTNLHSPDTTRRLGHLLTPARPSDLLTPARPSDLLSSQEQSRATSMTDFRTDPFGLHVSSTSQLTRSPALSRASAVSPTKTTDISAFSSASCGHQKQGVKESEDPFRVPATPPTASGKLTAAGVGSPGKADGTSPHRLSSGRLQSSCLSEQRSPDKIGDNIGTKQTCLNKTQCSPPGSKSQSSLVGRMDFSMMDTSTYPDMTYTSMLDGTRLGRLHQMFNLDHTLSATITDDLSSLTVDQLHSRLEHLERVNLTLREEIGVYEAIHRSQGTQVSPPLCMSTSSGGEEGNSDDDLLRQHLVEIRKLRQRLERLDITKDPEQLLIFQSHTQQRIARQESMLAHLQQQLVEKEEHHARECAQLQHRLARDKAALRERLEETITVLRRHLESQDSDIKEKERLVRELREELADAGAREEAQDVERRKTVSEKAELEEDLVKRDKEFLELEKMMFRLEMGKENAESDCRRLEAELKDKEKECGRLTKEVEENKENSKCLKEIVVKREKSLQEKVHCLQKMADEKLVTQQRIIEKENEVRKLEENLENLRKKMNEIRLSHDDEKGRLQSQLEELKSDIQRRESLEARNAFQRAGFEAELNRLTEEKSQMKAAHEREIDNERLEARRQIDELKKQARDRDELKNEVEMLRDKVTVVSELQYKVERLESKLDCKAALETELRERLDNLAHVEAEAKLLQENLERSEQCLRSTEEEKGNVQRDLEEREEKLKKRDKQLKNLISQHLKLDAIFTKQKNVLKEKVELLHSQKKQLRLFEVSLTCSSQEEKDDIMKQLLKELIATQRQVEELLSRLEHNPVYQPSVRVEAYGNPMSSSGVTATVTTSGPGSSSTSSGQDNVDTVLSVGVREASPENCLGSLSPCSSEPDLDLNPSSLVGGHTTTSSSSGPHSSPLRPVSTNFSQGLSGFSLSPRQLRYYSDLESAVMPGGLAQGQVSSDIRSLFAVLKLESHEKLRKESTEALAILSSVEARLEDRLRTFKAKSVSESLEYSTLREMSMSCRNLRMCLEEAVKLTASAWITELPPVDARGHFYDPILAEQNETLKRDLTLLRSRYDMLDHTVKEQQGRLQATNDRRKNWEQSLYKQLHKTAQDMEQAKENFEAGGFVPKGSQSLRLGSPCKSPRKRFDDTL